jgi:hypothetical protein
MNYLFFLIPQKDYENYAYFKHFHKRFFAAVSAKVCPEQRRFYEIS